MSRNKFEKKKVLSLHLSFLPLKRISYLLTGVGMDDRENKKERKKERGKENETGMKNTNREKKKS